jgi:hypothetical protein
MRTLKSKEQSLCPLFVSGQNSGSGPKRDDPNRENVQWMAFVTNIIFLFASLEQMARNRYELDCVQVKMRAFRSDFHKVIRCSHLTLSSLINPIRVQLTPVVTNPSEIPLEIGIIQIFSHPYKPYKYKWHATGGSFQLTRIRSYGDCFHI